MAKIVEMDALSALTWEDFPRPLTGYAAFAVTAYILPGTHACRNPPWSDWHRRKTPMPMELMRHYQRAKTMVGERRYDEALSLYHHALLYDADNIHLRYDVGQIFERLQLYPDALVQYAEITERLFPVQPAPAAPKPPEVDPRPGGRIRRLAAPRRRSDERPNRGQVRRVEGVSRLVGPALSPRTDAFLVRYRYLSVLSTSQRLVLELLDPDWPMLQAWLRWQDRPGAPEPDAYGQRPWRTVELTDLRRRLAEQLDPIWQEALNGRSVLGGSRTQPGLGLTGVLLDQPSSDTVPAFVALLPENSGWRALPPHTARLLAVEDYFLAIAGAEAELLLADFEYFWLTPRRGATTNLTSVTLKIMRSIIALRHERLRLIVNSAIRMQSGQKLGASGPENMRDWPPDPARMDQDLAAAGYNEGSRRWLEHYVAACFLALPLLDDDTEVPGHQAFAEAAVRALERAQRCGDDIEFVISKRYWLLAGDPDLAGLRKYDCFRAFESRVYLHPQPSTDSAQYELFHYLRQGLERGAQLMEQIWIERAERSTVPAPSVMEEWFREERSAWQVCVRLGRFYRQWQTRSSGLEALRTLIATHGAGPVPVPYPEAVRDYTLVGIGGPAAAGARVVGMQRLFAHLANGLGTLASIDGHTSLDGQPPAAQTESIIDKTRAWIWYSEHVTRGSASFDMTKEQVTDLCARRAAVWSALRHWTTTPARRDHHLFTAAVEQVPSPPPIDLTALNFNMPPSTPHHTSRTTPESNPDTTHRT